MKIENKLSEDRKDKESKEFTIKVYAQPKIIKLGALQSVTLGGSIGVGDSAGIGDPANEKTFS